MKIKAVCTDIDGTLLNKDRVLSPRTVAAIRAICDKVPVILASSRMPAAMRHLQQELGIEDHPMICFNGGYVLCFSKGSQSPIVLDSVPMSLSIGEKVVDLARDSPLHVSLFSGNEWFTATPDEWTEREARITKVHPQIIPFVELMHQREATQAGFHKIMCMGTATDIDRIDHALTSTLDDQVHRYRSKSTYLEIAPKAVSKATALALVMQREFGVSLDDVMAFGDNYNDIDMIRDVGLGIAVGNAIPDVKHVANAITLAGKEDGVAVALEKYFSL